MSETVDDMLDRVKREAAAMKDSLLRQYADVCRAQAVMIADLIAANAALGREIAAMHGAGGERTIDLFKDDH